MNELKIENLIQIEQLPKIFSQLDEISTWIDNGIKELDLDNLVCTEDNKQEIKKTRTNIKKISTTLETRRKEIKSQILEPYQLFEEKYNNCIKNKLSEADSRLGEAINEIETNQKVEKELELREFFDNYTETYHLNNMFTFEQIGLNITLSASMSSLKEQIKKFVEQRNSDIQAINSFENKEEYMFEYQNNNFDLSKTMSVVNERHKALEMLNKKLEEKQDSEIQEQKVVENINTLVSAPIEIEEEKLTVGFEIVATRSQIKELKMWLKERNIDYKW